MDGKVTNQDLYNLIQGIAEQNQQIKEYQIQTCKDIKDEIRSIRSELLDEIRDLKEENTQLKEANDRLQERLEKIDKKLKKYNIIAYGVSEKSTEIDDIQIFLEIINKTLKIDCRFEDIRDIYRIGKPKQGTNRPLFVELVNYKLKLDIFKNAKELKGTGIFLSSDLTPEEQQKQKLLREALKLAKDNNCQATIKKNILYVNNRAYTYEELKSRSSVFPNTEATKTALNLERNHCNPNEVEQSDLQQETHTPVTTDHPFEFLTEFSTKKRKIANEETEPLSKRTPPLRTTRSNVRNK